MIIFKQAHALQSHLQKVAMAKLSIGFVPTMGALHDGHISLLKRSKKIAGITVCSIFINPTQFNNAEDLEKYPVNTEKDIYLLEKAGCDILFLPGVEEIYPANDSKDDFFELGNIENIVEGKYRPGHFQGVCMVVKRLLKIVNPAYLLAGQKDYQQCLVLQKLLSIINSPAKLIICDTKRENDGLAMSSRNLRLTKEERIVAPEIYHTLSFAAQQLKPGTLKNVKEKAINRLTKNGFNVDYIEIAKADDLQPVDVWDGNTSLIVLAAAYINKIRLIDNIKIQQSVN